MKVKEMVILTVISTFSDGNKIRCVNANGLEVSLSKLERMFIDYEVEDIKTSSAAAGNGNWVCSTTIIVFTEKD